MEELQNVISGPQEEKKAALLSVSYLNILNIGENTRTIPALLRSFCSLLFDLHADFYTLSKHQCNVFKSEFVFGAQK